MVRFKNVNEFEAWLLDKPHEWAAALAARAAARAIPAFASLDLTHHPSLTRTPILSAFRATAVSLATAKHPTNVAKGLVFAAAFTAGKVDGAAAATAAAAAAVNAVAIRRPGDVAVMVAHAVKDSIEALGGSWTSATGDPDRVFPRTYGTIVEEAAIAILGAISAEADLLDAGTSADRIAEMRIWISSEAPGLVDSDWTHLKTQLEDNGEGWWVWTAWYQRLLQGRAAHADPDVARDIDLAYVLIDDEDWEQGPAHVNALIKARIAEIEARYGGYESDSGERDTGTVSQDSLQTLADVTQLSIGNSWTVRRDFLAIEHTADEHDLAVAQRPSVQQSHNSVKRKADTLLAVGAGVGEQYGWDGFEDVIRRFHSAVDRPTSDLPEVVAAVYDELLTLGSFLDQDNDLRALSTHTNMSKLDAPVRRALSDVIRSAAPWAREFPTVRAKDDEAGSFLRQPALFAPAAALASTAQQVALISEEDRKVLQALLQAAERSGFPGEKAGVRGVSTARNLVVKSAALLASFYFGATASAFSGESLLVQKASRFLLEREAEVIAFVEEEADDVRIAVTEMLDDLKRNPPTPGSPDPIIAEPSGRREDG